MSSRAWSWEYEVSFFLEQNLTGGLKIANSSLFIFLGDLATLKQWEMGKAGS